MITARTLARFSLVSGFSVVLFLFWWIYEKESGVAQSQWISELPALNALLNGITSILLVSGFLAIKKGAIKFHQKCMILATFSSALFLVSYLTYHHYQGDTKFLAIGAIRPIYFSILISHIILSIVQVPLILMTLAFAFTNNLKQHRKIAPWTFWIWLYVSVTGILIFLMLKYFNNS